MKKYKIMKKQTNISVLKELVNNNVMERVELYTRGVQAYNIAEGEEYNVIVAYEKQGGRYYFIDRDGRRFLASRYYRAEFVAGEMLEVIANDRAAAQHAADQLVESGSVLVNLDILTLFFDECDRRKIKVTTSSAVIVDDLGCTFARYNLVRDDEPTNNNEDDQTQGEPSTFTQVVAQVTESIKTSAALRAAHRISMIIRTWLRASHEFYAHDGDPIKCSGWQFVGYNIIAAVVAILLCIKY